MYTEEIMGNWKTEPRNNETPIKSLQTAGYPARTITFDDGWRGVAVLFPHDTEVNEDFSNVWLRTTTIVQSDGSTVKVLALLSTSCDRPFAALCSNFVDPGFEGGAREGIVADPIAWWKSWRDLLGNRSVDYKIYDVLGELIVLRYLIKEGMSPEWRGPDYASDDIDCGHQLVEVKSTVSRNSKSFVAHGFYQLADAGIAKKLAFCRFEQADSGETIDAVVDDLVSLGCQRESMERKLTSLGYPKGRGARSRGFVVLSVSLYDVDDNFPHLGKSSFVGGDLPPGITGLQYCVMLDGVPCEDVTDKCRW